MELLPLSYPLPFNLKLIQSRPSSKQPGFSFYGKRKKLSSVMKPSFSLSISNHESYKMKNLDEKEGIRLLSFLESPCNQDAIMAGDGSFKYHAVDRNVSLNDIPKVDQIEKLLIPSLPNDSNGNHGSQISSCYWEWKPKFLVHYEKSETKNIGAPGVLFLPGFGVGAFHYEKQLKDLGRDYRVWALDFLGQGHSLPSEDPAPSSHNTNSEESHAKWGFGNESEPWARDLVYSIDLWRDQVQHFVEQVIGEPVYVVGNSLGGFVALYFAAFNPQLVKGITLLNATPFWGFLPNPIRSPRLSRFFPWAGTFPLPSSMRKPIYFVWQKISEPKNIEEILKQVYADHSTKIDGVFSRIVEITQHPAAAAAFTSIMFAPRSQLSFEEALIRCELQNVPICLIYGKDDPWVRPIWGLKIKSQLPQTPYYEISPAGHCPHDEVPEVVNFLLRGWIKSLESKDPIPLPLLEEPQLNEFFSRELVYVREEGFHKSVRVRFFGSNVSLWDQTISFLGSSIGKLLFNDS